MPKVGVVLSGCGVRDGSEIHETVCTILALEKFGAEAVFMAPNIPQANVVNHLENAVLEGEARNVLVESARIARGRIQDLAVVKADQLDAVIFPGGMGAAANLCTFETDGVNCKINDQVERLINEMLDAGKPIGALCIAPVLVAKALANRGLTAMVTIGTDKETAEKITAMGGCHVDCPVHECVVDNKHKVVTTPCYMLARSIEEVYRGVTRMVEEVLQLL